MRISTIRELAIKVAELRDIIRHWLNKVQVLVEYYINTPKEGRAPDGAITSSLVNGPIDEIIVKNNSREEASRFRHEKLRRHFPEASKKTIS